MEGRENCCTFKLSNDRFHTTMGNALSSLSRIPFICFYSLPLSYKICPPPLFFVPFLPPFISRLSSVYFSKLVMPHVFFISSTHYIRRSSSLPSVLIFSNFSFSVLSSRLCPLLYVIKTNLNYNCKSLTVPASNVHLFYWNIKRPLSKSSEIQM